MGAKCLAEFIGTFLLVLTVGCNVLAKNAVWGGVSIGSVLMVAIYAFGGISGANFNPAVSIALGAIKAMGVDPQEGRKGMAMAEVGIYCAVQVFAGLLAGAIYTTLFWKDFELQPTKGFDWWRAGLCELFYTCMLCFVVLNVAAKRLYRGEEPNHFYGLAIGYVVVAGAYGAGAVSGGAFNPAVAIGVDVSSPNPRFGWWPTWVIFEVLGALLAAALFKVVRPGDFEYYSSGQEQSRPKVPVHSALAAEFLGTFMLVLTVGLNVLGKSQAGAFSIAASLMCMIYALGDVSGAHFNPAVTLAVLVSGRDRDPEAAAAMLPPFVEAGRASEERGLEPKLAASYVAVQLAGGLLAGLTYSLIYKHAEGGSSFPLGPKSPYGWTEVAVAEVIFTGLLCYTVLCVAVSKQTKSANMFGLAIGSCVTVGGFAIGGISGGSLNPAVSFGIAASHSFSSILGAFPAYAILECLGAAAAAGLFQATHIASSGKAN